nr:unnamed protein product [Naegleria fowleri]
MMKVTRRSTCSSFLWSQSSSKDYHAQAKPQTSSLVSCQRRSQRSSSKKARQILSQQLFIPDLQEEASSSTPKKKNKKRKIHHENDGDDHNNNSTTFHQPQPPTHHTKGRSSKITETSKKQIEQETNQTLLSLFQCIEKEYEEKIKILLERCFLLEQELYKHQQTPLPSHYISQKDHPPSYCENCHNPIHKSNIHKKRIDDHNHSSHKDDSIKERTNIDDSSHSPILSKFDPNETFSSPFQSLTTTRKNSTSQTPQRELPYLNDQTHNRSCEDVMMGCGNDQSIDRLFSTPFSSCSQHEEAKQMDQNDSYQIVTLSPLEIELDQSEEMKKNHETDHSLLTLNSNKESSSSLRHVWSTPQRRAIVSKPLETHFNASPALSDTSSEATDLDFNWLFEQENVSQVSTVSTSTISKRTTRQSEKKQQISKVIEHLQTELHAEIILPNLILTEGDVISSSSQKSTSPSLSQDYCLSKTPMSDIKRSATKRLTTPNGSSELTLVSAVKKSQRSQNSRIYTRTDYKYRDFTLSENIIFFCKYINFKPKYLFSHTKLGLSDLFFDVIDLIEKERSKYKFLKTNKDSMIIGDCNEGLLVVKLSECEKTFHTHVLSKLNQVILSKQEHRKKRLIREYCFGGQSLSQVFDFDFPCYLIRDEEPSRHEGPFSIFDVLLNCVNHK